MTDATPKDIDWNEPWKLQLAQADGSPPEAVVWGGNITVGGTLVAFLEHSDGTIDFYRYALDEDAIESFIPLSEDEYPFFLQCCAALEAATR